MYRTREEIKNWLNQMEIENYVINEDLTVDVNGNVNISFKILTDIPVKFNIVDGSFNCSNNKLTSLESCPKEIKGDFYCSCNQLTSLEGCPKEVKGDFYCSYNQLTSLKGCPEVIQDGFNCSINELTSLEGCPEIINGFFDCSYNKLTNFEFFTPKIISKRIFINKNKIKEEELVNFNCDIKNVDYIYSDFNNYGNKKEFIEKVNCQKIKKENELLKELSVNSNNVKLNKKL